MLCQFTYSGECASKAPNGCLCGQTARSHQAMVSAYIAEEYDLLLRVVAAATDVVNECKGDVPPSLGGMALLAAALAAHWKFQRGEQ